MWKKMLERAAEWLASMRKQPQRDPGLEGAIDPDETQDMPELRIDDPPPQTNTPEPELPSVPEVLDNTGVIPDADMPSVPLPEIDVPPAVTSEQVSLDDIVQPENEQAAPWQHTATPTQDEPAIDSNPLPDSAEPTIDKPQSPTTSDQPPLDDTALPELSQETWFDEQISVTDDMRQVFDEVHPVSDGLLSLPETAPDNSLPRLDVPQRSEAGPPLPLPGESGPGEVASVDPTTKAESVEFYPHEQHTPESASPFGAPLLDPQQSEPEPPETSEPPPPRPTEAQIDRIFRSSEDDESPPLTNRVRVPPELADQPIGQPPPGLVFDQASEDAQLPTPNQPNDSNEKPMTERQGEQIIRQQEEQLRVLEEIKSGQESLVTAIENLATSLQNVGGLLP